MREGMAMRLFSGTKNCFLKLILYYILIIYLFIKLGLCSRQISLSFSNCIIYFIVIVSKL